MMFRKNSPRTVLIAAVFCLPLVVGCGPVIGWLAAVFKGPEKVKAVYYPPEDKKILVFVDDLACPLSYEPVKRIMTEKINKMLVDNKVAADVVSYEDLLNLSMADKNFNQLGVSNIGRKLGADLVIFIEVKQFQLKEYEETELWHGKFKTEVSVIDCNVPKECAHLWPENLTDGMEIGPLETDQHDHTISRDVDVANKLADLMADVVGKLFYDHEVETGFGE